MNCAAMQRSLLSCERPEQPPLEVRRHLVACADCQTYQRRLVEIEQQLPLLPVPPSTGRAAFLARVRVGEVPVPAAPSILPLWLQRSQPPLKERGLKKLAVAFALAAALAAFALAWWAWPHPYADRQHQRDQLLSQARTPRERVEVLARLADRLQKEAQQLVQRQSGDQLNLVARFYREVVQDNLLEYARQLPREDRETVLKTIAEQLNNIESEVERLLAEVPENSKAPLRDIALASRQSHDQLRALLRAA